MSMNYSRKIIAGYRFTYEDFGVYTNKNKNKNCECGNFGKEGLHCRVCGDKFTTEKIREFKCKKEFEFLFSDLSDSEYPELREDINGLKITFPYSCSESYEDFVIGLPVIDVEDSDTGVFRLVALNKEDIDKKLDKRLISLNKEFAVWFVNSFG